MSNRAYRVKDYRDKATFNVSHSQPIIDYLPDSCIYHNGYSVGYINIAEEQLGELVRKLKEKGKYEEVEEDVERIKEDIRFEGGSVGYICY